jgi:hypothetical protein
MLCEKYMKLTPQERAHYIGELAHIVMNDDSLFKSGLALIELGRRKGLLDNVIIMPSPDEETAEDNPINNIP